MVAVADDVMPARPCVADDGGEPEMAGESAGALEQPCFPEFELLVEPEPYLEAEPETVLDGLPDGVPASEGEARDRRGAGRLQALQNVTN